MKKRIVSLFTVLILCAMMVAPAAASTYAEFTDSTGRVWGVGHTNGVSGESYTVCLSVADRLALLTREMYPVLSLEQQVVDLAALCERFGFDVDPTATYSLRLNLLSLYPDQYSLITYSDVYTLVRFAREQLETPAFRELYAAMLPLKGSEMDGLDFRITESLRFVYSEERMSQIYGELERILKDDFGNSNGARLLATLEPVTILVPSAH